MCPHLQDPTHAIAVIVGQCIWLVTAFILMSVSNTAAATTNYIYVKDPVLLQPGFVIFVTGLNHEGQQNTTPACV